MDRGSHKHFAFNFKEVLLDEIALDGLEGTVTELLWRRVEKRITSPVTEKMKSRFWHFIVNCDDVSFYKLPEPREPIEILDRYQSVDEECGYIIDPPDYLDGPYEYNPVENEFGSCANYSTRVPVSKCELCNLPYKDVEEKYGNSLVLVASLQERWKALSPQPISQLSQITAVQYCILELIGRARENGQATTGKTNILKIVKDSKLLFYNRKFLEECDLIRVQRLSQIIGVKTVKSLLLVLKRFHQPLMQCLPRRGKVYDVVQYLLTKPNHTEYTEEIIRDGVVKQAMYRKLKKSCNFLRIEKSSETPHASTKKSKRIIKSNTTITLNVESDESSQSENETTEEPMKCQYNVHIPLMRQVYEKLLEAGNRGLTQVETAELLGLEFYSARTMFRCLKARNLVREFFEDKGKQRITRFVATVSSIKGNSSTYEEEKRKLMEQLDTPKIDVNKSVGTTAESDSEVPRKKIKLEPGTNIDNDTTITDTKSFEQKVTVLSCVDGLENLKSRKLFTSKKAPTLRQLKYANGILKVIKEKLVITGYQTLSIQVAKEIDEPPMDTKGIKIFVQKLVEEGQIKVLKLTWPGVQQKFTIVLCAPHIQPTDPLIQAKVKEVHLRALRLNTQTKVERPVSESGSKRVTTIYLYPRYMKLQKLHEWLMNLVYFNDDETYHSNLPKGFSSIYDLIPEFTLEFALANLSHIGLATISHMKILTNMLPCKLRNLPADIFKMLLSSSSLQSVLRQNLKYLAMFGLIQLIKEPGTDEKSVNMKFVFYVNRNAKIIDTREEWPREVADMEALEKRYHFESFEDVQKFWNDVCNISQNTIINLPSGERSLKNTIMVPRLKEDVDLYDNGQILGNGSGPCGYDSSFHMEIPRFWSLQYTKFLKRPSSLVPKKVTVVKKPKREKRKRNPRRNLNKIKPKVIVEKKEPSKVLKRRRDRLVKWSTEDDRIITLCKAALIVMSPVAQPGCLKLRNLVSKDILSINDPKKLATLCHKRALLLESNSALAYEKDCVINELKRHPNVTRKYEDLFKTIRAQYPNNMTSLINTARLPMMELVWIMLQLVKSTTFNQQVPCVALSLEDFHDNFKIHPASANKKYNLYKTPLEFGPELATLKEAIIVTVMATFKITQPPVIATVIYSMFCQYPEVKMRPAMEQLRKCAAVAAREKIINAQIGKHDLQDIMHSCYKISSHYQRRWINRLNTDFTENLISILDKGLPQSGLKGSPEINCLLLELNTTGVLDLTTAAVPVICAPSGSYVQEHQLTVFDITMHFNLKSGTLGWRKKADIKKFSDLYQNLQFQEILDTILINARVHDPVETADKDDNIILHLKEKKESGATFAELQDLTRFDTSTLMSKLSSMESAHVIKRVGYYENVIILTEFATPWSITIEDTQIIPTPWLNLDLEIRTDIFIKWASVVMNKVYKHPGCSIAYLSDQAEFLTTRAVQDICVVLEKTECVKIKCLKVSEPSLFSDDDDKEIPEFEEFNPYESVENILLFPVKDSLTRFAYLKKLLFDDYFGPERLP